MKKIVYWIACLLLIGYAGIVAANGQKQANTLKCKKDPSCKQLEKRIALHQQMAEDYYLGYDQETVEQGLAYASWTIAEGAVYWSPYFTNYETIPLGTIEDVAMSATIEANAYRYRFPDWGPVEFKSWPSDHGFVMRTKFEGTNKCTGKTISFYTHGFVETNADGEITHWETWPDTVPYDIFLKEAIGRSGPWNSAAEYYMTIMDWLDDPNNANCPVSE